MRQLKFLAWVAGVSVMVLASVGHADDTSRSFGIGDAGSLNLTLPDGWSATTDNRKPPHIQLLSPREKQVSVEIAPLQSEVAESKLKDAAELVGQHYLQNSKEKKITLEDLKGEHLHGFVSRFTNRVTGSSDFACVTAGVVVCDNQLLMITVLYPDKSSPEHAAAMKLIQELSITPPKPLAKQIAIKSPDGKWSVIIPGQWKVSQDDTSKDGKSKQATAISTDGTLVLTAFFDPAEGKGGDSAAARDFYMARMKKLADFMQHPKQETVGEFATLQYDQGTAGFIDRNVDAYLSHDGIWVDLHISKTDYNEKSDKAAFDAMVKGLKRE